MTQYKILHCGAGNHEYDWPVKRGKRPANCPGHKPSKQPISFSKTEDISGKIRSVLDFHQQRGTPCDCGIISQMTRDELTSLRAGCTEGVGFVSGYVCPVLDSVRRVVGYAPFTD